MGQVVTFILLHRQADIAGPTLGFGVAKSDQKVADISVVIGEDAACSPNSHPIVEAKAGRGYFQVREPTFPHTGCGVERPLGFPTPAWPWRIYFGFVSRVRCGSRTIFFVPGGTAKWNRVSGPSTSTVPSSRDLAALTA
jgi:hypothetical protein